MGPEGVYLTHPDPEIRAFTARYLIDLVNFCGDIGGRVLVFGSPQQRNISRDVTYNQAFGFAREIFEKALPACEKRGVTICMEQLTHWETNFCYTPEQTVERLGHSHPNFQLLSDTKAMSYPEDDRPTVIGICRYLRHYHATTPTFTAPVGEMWILSPYSVPARHPI